ncbi:TonB-dependent receptor [Mucilaginibacter sabulilitoris]|uniref:TonB-dependent receptor n=1 Tax=Mucilaginibacter sabulilitoris TaxID=1173583 RepID=A0ABZ0TY63_9SPHI|nr:TonB-dependent receptor [Mucilaginibacter sabulilitoris]WPU97088.1 TonB-dependent receptor [Mucilaginibacter sabulilitoris]
MRINIYKNIAIPYTINSLFKFMRIQLAIILLFQTMCMAGTIKGQTMNDTRISLSAHNISLKVAFNTIEQKTTFSLGYNANDIDANQKVNINAVNEPVLVVLKKLLKGYKGEISQVNDRNIFLKVRRTEPGSFFLVQKIAPAGRVTGQVIDETGQPLPGVSVTEKGARNSTSTDNNGKYGINAPDNAVLVFRFIGYAPIEQTVQLKGGQEATMNVSMKPTNSGLNEVVVVGYGTQKKANLTGAVDQVGSEYFDDRPVPNVTRGLEGVIPNLNIKMTDGKPTRSATYNIRGTTSIGSGGSALILIDGVPGDPNTVNPNDIESVSVLKDASSAAIYGSRAAYGVVLITTKTPKVGKVQITYSGNYSINKQTIKPDLLSNGYQWAQNFDEAFNAWYDYLSHPTVINSQPAFSLSYLDSLKRHDANPGLPQVSVDPLTGNYQYFANTDWFKELYKDNNATMEHSLSVSGGSDKVKFSVSGRFYDQDGIFRYNTDKYRSYNLRFKGSVKVNDWLTVNGNSEYATFNYKYPLTSVGGVNAVWRLMAVSAFPLAPLLNPDGTLTYTAAQTVGDFYYGKSNSTLVQNFNKSTIGFTASPIRKEKSKLTINGDFSYLRTDTTDTRKFFPVPYSSKPGQLITSGLNYLSNSVVSTRYYNANLYGQYSQTMGNHNVQILVGGNIEHSLTKGNFEQRDGLLVDDLSDFNLATGLNYRLLGGGSEWSTAGIFYRANYAYKNKYLFELDGRYDDSSKFPQEQAFGFFPSASAGWNISEEKFMEGTKSWLTNWKLRGSYGSLGNGNIAPYTFLATLGPGTSSYIANGAYLNYISQPRVLPNGLTWEKVTTANVGTDVDMLNGRLSTSVDIYQRKTTNMITVGQPLPAVFGTAVPKGNFADLSTKGWEVSVTWRDKIDTRKPITYSLRLTLADNVAHITKFYNPNNILPAPYTNNTYYVGERLGDIWGYQTDGFFTSTQDIQSHADQSYFVVSNNNKLLPGDLKFRDINGDGKVNNGKNTLNDPGDQSVIGNSAPRYPYGITGNVGWNNFSLEFFFQGLGQRDWYPSPEAANFWGQYNRPYSFVPAGTLNHWTEENPSQDAYFPRYRGYTALSGTRELAVPQTRYLQDASYIRLKTLTIGYNLPANLLKKLNFTSVRIYFTGQNLWTYSPIFKYTKDFDPEVIEGSDPEINATQGDGFSYPMQKTYTLGVQVAL